MQIRIVVRSDSGKITNSYWGHGKTPMDVGDDIPKFCPPIFCGLSAGIESLSAEKVITSQIMYNLLIPPTISVNTMAEVLDGNNVPTTIIVRIVFPVPLRGPKPVWAQTYEIRAPLSRSSI
jgi:hypothetical protein